MSLLDTDKERKIVEEYFNKLAINGRFIFIEDLLDFQPFKILKLRKEVVKALNEEVFSDKIDLQHLLMYMIVFHKNCKLDYKFEFLFRMIDTDKDEYVSKLDFIEFFRPFIDESRYKIIEMMIHKIFEACDKDDKNLLHINDLRGILNEELKVIVYKLMTINLESL